MLDKALTLLLAFLVLGWPFLIGLGAVLLGLRGLPRLARGAGVGFLILGLLSFPLTFRLRDHFVRSLSQVRAGTPEAQLEPLLGRPSRVAEDAQALAVFSAERGLTCRDLAGSVQPGNRTLVYNRFAFFGYIGVTAGRVASVQLCSS